jgi:hypothetical protein
MKISFTNTNNHKLTINLAEIAAAALPLSGIQAFQGSLIAPLPFFPSPTNPTHKNSNKPFQSWQFPKAVALPNST